MTLHPVRMIAALTLAMVGGLAIAAFAQQAAGKRDFDAEYRAAVQSAIMSGVTGHLVRRGRPAVAADR